MVTLHISSTTKFERVAYKHLGFPARQAGQRHIRHRDDLYLYNGLLEPAIDAQVVILPFKLYLKNVGDSFIAVHVRLPLGTDRCKLTLLQEKHQPKAPKEIDDFVKYQSIWYATATVNCLQTLRIEELEGNV